MSNTTSKMQKPATGYKGMNHLNLYKMDQYDIAQVASDYLQALLTKVSISTVQELTRLNRRTIYRWMDESLPVDVISMTSGGYFITIVETHPRIQKILNSAPEDNAYYERS